MKSTPLVSVIVPIYNVEKYLKRCVDSILSQTFTDYELILVDDGSPDDCGTICDEYKQIDERVRVIHKENGGLSSARNAGLDISIGKYIWFCDSDDYVDKNLLDIMVPLAESGVDMPVFQLSKEDDEKGVYYRSCLECKDYSLSGVNRKYFVINELLAGNITWTTCNRFFNKAILEHSRMRFVDNKVIFAEDLYFTLCYCGHIDRAKVIDEYPYYYWQRSDSIMGQQTFSGNLERFSKLAEAVFDHWTQFPECDELIEAFPLIYYCILYPEIQRIMNHNSFTPQEMRQYILEKIENKEFYQQNISQTIKYFDILNHEKWDKEYHRRKYELDYWNNDNYFLYCVRCLGYNSAVACRNFVLKCWNFLRYRVGLLMRKENI